MVVDSLLSNPENGPNDHRKDAPPSLYEFRLFSENDNFDDGYLHEKFTRSYIGRIHKNLEFHPSYNFSSKMTIQAKK